MRGKILLGALLLLTTVAVWSLQTGRVSIPDRWNPWAPLELAAEPNFLTRWKLDRLSNDDALCLRVLADAELEYEALSDRETGPGCGFRNAVRIDRTSAALNDSFSLTCRSAVSLALWEQHILQPASQKHFGQPVARLEHFGSYSCRNVYGRASGRRSRHATAEALDVAGFVLADDTRIRIVNDWNEDGPASAFLHEVRTGACRFFDAVLSPEYNEAHRDHLHLDRGPWRVCR